MKKILALFVLISSLFTLVSCQSAFSNTKVRVVGLSYSSLGQTLASFPSNNSMRLLSNKLLADEVDEYIFPGDVLTFTVELEDPNFEFISLLSIKFNGRVIRANVDNSIVTTRDCGENICVDFPFEIAADKSEYSVQEVKFAKLNSDNGVNAIIDNQSIKTVVIDVYTDEVFPYVVESVQTLNNAIQSMTFYENDIVISSNIEINSFRLFTVINFDQSINSFNKIIVKDGIFFEGTWNTIVYADWRYKTELIDYYYITQQRIEVKYYGPGTQESAPPEINFWFFQVEYQDVFFFNIGNAIYVDILGNKHLLIDMVNDMRIISYYWWSIENKAK